MNYEILDDDGNVINRIIADDDFVNTHYPGKYRKLPLTDADIQAKSDEMRDLRNKLLAATDWSQAADVPQAIKDKYATYRQALRDVPQQPGFPENVQWPVKPE